MAPMLAHRDRNTVCVMDASSPLGASLVDRLLQRGYTVHAAAYNNHDSDELESLMNENKRVKVFRADPLDYQSIMDAVKGCSGLFYTFEQQPQDQPFDELTAEVEVRAAHNVLEACAQTETMERVVFTSSVTAVVWKEDRKLMANFDERHWSEPNYCRRFKLVTGQKLSIVGYCTVVVAGRARAIVVGAGSNTAMGSIRDAMLRVDDLWHALAKTLAEKTAWALAMDRGVDMVSLNAGLVLGPGLSAASPYLKGTPEMYEDGVLVTVDLKFLVDAHVAVYESPSAYGRYLCFNDAVCRPEDAVRLAQILVPSAGDSRPPPCSEELRVIQQRIQNKKMNKIMVDFAAERHVEL